MDGEIFADTATEEVGVLYRNGELVRPKNGLRLTDGIARRKLV